MLLDRSENQLAGLQKYIRNLTDPIRNEKEEEEEQAASFRTLDEVAACELLRKRQTTYMHDVQIKDEITGETAANVNIIATAITYNRGNENVPFEINLRFKNGKMEIVARTCRELKSSQTETTEESNNNLEPQPSTSGLADDPVQVQENESEYSDQSPNGHEEEDSNDSEEGESAAEMSENRRSGFRAVRD